ncbi:hypothetical protein [Nocardia macrotermitis]|uniref:Uncharacterized protein n=1 Tax=Nocardia macrotermitis TaxID=2585198 RepID=A0A7K0D0E3_9NOCA|nr:hypothetical protein [Nocardia macrotermitis]MQY19189.1 hypothetical protein [Nocardia macrotermitis]
MLALVWLIDLLVIAIRILGGRTKVNPVVRLALWLIVLLGLAAVIAAIGAGLVLLDHYLTSLN